MAIQEDGEDSIAHPRDIDDATTPDRTAVTVPTSIPFSLSLSKKGVFNCKLPVKLDCLSISASFVH